MTQQEERQGPGAGQRTAEFMAEGRQRIEDFADAQAQFWDRVQDSNRKWLDRFQTEATMAADFANKLTSAKSLTDTANLFQNWTVKHMELATEDARRMLSDTQEIMAAGARFWSNVGAGDGRGRGH
ncbi:phasin family protein [Methylocystis parvus]|uniref:Phasin family protein n=1 Tax=Methylocystis parvus TaxID=134 RepID=A0A6B8M9L3_9HYPH|nr:phasin family protein [Methylocystis parvus]QGM99366.1 hypothetical protein F7D14_19025 [Methylocystis parvus]WBK00241.1 hypothetical protein MMG94_00510 [Methylocystis parvus OBBP]